MEFGDGYPMRAQSGQGYAGVCVDAFIEEKRKGQGKSYTSFFIYRKFLTED